MHSSLLAYVCFQHASCLLYIGMKQVIYSVHSCMVSLVIYGYVVRRLVIIIIKNQARLVS